MNQPSPLIFPSKILIVDDVPENLQLLATTLTKQGYQVRRAKNGAMALMGARNNLPDLILLDINMPDMNGYQVCEQLKADRATRSIPIIFLSAQDDLEDKVRAFNFGGADFIGKPFQVEEVLARVRNQLALQAAQAEIRTLNAELEQRVRQRTAELESANFTLKQEIFQRHQLETKLRHDALHDSLTELPNRSFLMEQIEKCLYQTIDNPHEQFAIFFIDLDRFKIINDSLGHLAGDELLIACAQRLSKCSIAETTLARLGGDEFIILLERVSDVNDVIAVAEKILQEFAFPFKIGNRSLTITVSIGIAIGNCEYHQAIDLLRDADTALYRAKELGKARYEIFTQQLYIKAIRRLELENELREGIFNQELVLYYQPIFSLDGRVLKGFEALVRWQHPQRGFISPAEFIPLAEETGLIIPLGKWVIKEACHQLKTWQEKLPAAKSLTMSVNVTANQLHHADFLTSIDRIIAETQIDSCFLKLELTESMLIDNSDKVTQVLEQLKNRHIQLSIDDFGTGYSSLSYLPQFPVDILKIDRSFVNAMNVNRQNHEIVKTIVTLAQALNMQVVAEGIETEIQFDSLQSLGVELGQGFLISQPLTPELATSMIESNFLN
jgi:diguanylate cyclase (GGDEF)-like protein